MAIIRFITTIFCIVLIGNGCWRQNKDGGTSSQKKNDGTDEETPQQIAKRALQSVVIIYMSNSQGSGFFVRDGIVVTNFHVVKGSTEGIIKSLETKQEFPILNIIVEDEENDLALLKIAEGYHTVLPFGDVTKIQRGDKVYALGNPQGLEGTFSEGSVSAEDRVIKNKHLIQYTAPISGGSSGGPILNTKGEVIGVTKSSIDEGQNLNFAIPISKVQELLNRIPQ
ncbi:MAG: trypsin-like peptidase domain-containing protein [Bacteroidetes bacterium]|nr:trypsin-like peptidase domain-containing protein [Bacteroidota bacterium]